MEINLRSSAGRAFSAQFDPITVAMLIGLAVGDAETRYRSSLSTEVDKLVNPNTKISDDAVLAIESVKRIVDSDIAVDFYAPSVLEAFRTFVAEYKLLQTGSGSERACMEAFMSLCELLQGD